MIVWKEWARFVRRNSTNVWYYEGWFLFGFIPLFIKRKNAHVE